ncbi:hypothetical protein B0H13DRAFT_1883743 [Mycena leptocephala]|nr:hypothetical protein B0H13DRAFT_1883743 [Mycena leptocephala]
MHTTSQVESVASRLASISSKWVNQKLDTPRERSVQYFIQKHGGAQGLINDDAKLLEFIAKSSVGAETLSSIHPSSDGLSNARKLLQAELQEGVDDAVRRSMDMFDRKLDLFRDALVGEPQVGMELRPSPAVKPADSADAALEAARASSTPVVLPEPQQKIDVMAAINSAGSALPLAVTLDVQSIERTITKFAEASAIIMKGLEALEKVHPFIGVLPFKLMISLDVTRRQNNKKVLAVQIQMQDMMTVLFQLRNIRDSTEKGSHGISLEDNMSSIIEIVPNTITECGSACDVYLKKHLLSFVKSFHQHKKNIQFILGMHASQGVAEANLKLDSHAHHWETIETQMGELLRRLNSTQEEGRKLIEQEGGPYIGGFASVKKALNKELAEDLHEVFRKNMKFFDRKLQRQEKRLRNELTRSREMILDALARGPHEKIVDEDLQKLWQDQDWKHKVDRRYAKTIVAFVPGTQPQDDSWVPAYITVMRMQPILEAVDDDGIGFVSIKEATRLRPTGWSLPAWVAFWAAGWHMTVTWLQTLILRDRQYGTFNCCCDPLDRETAMHIKICGWYFWQTRPGRIERRHFDILRLACLHTLDESGFITMTTSLVNIFKAVNMRANSLEAIFKSNPMDIKERLGRFAFGMFPLGDGKHLRDPINNTIRSFEEEDGLNDQEEDLGPQWDECEERVQAILARVPTDILRYEIPDDHENPDAKKTRTDPPRARRSWSLKTLDKSRRFIELLQCSMNRGFRTLAPCTTLSDEEQKELEKLQTELTPGDLQVCYSKVQSKLKQLVPFKQMCDSCGREIYGAHLFCIQCMDPFYSDCVNLGVECINQSVERPGFAHEPAHLFAKMYRRLHDGDFAWVVLRAKLVAEHTKKGFRAPTVGQIPPATGDTAGGVPKQATPLCSCCGKSVSLPCFACVECGNYICMACDTAVGSGLGLEPTLAMPQNAPSSPRSERIAQPQDPVHALVHVFNAEPVLKPLTTDARLFELEKKVVGLDAKMTSWEGTLGKILNGIEKLSRKK